MWIGLSRPLSAVAGDRISEINVKTENLLPGTLIVVKRLKLDGVPGAGGGWLSQMGNQMRTVLRSGGAVASPRCFRTGCPRDADWICYLLTGSGSRQLALNVLAGTFETLPASSY
jgi:hypothetical protein